MQIMLGGKSCERSVEATKNIFQIPPNIADIIVDGDTAQQGASYNMNVWVYVANRSQW